MFWLKSPPVTLRYSRYAASSRPVWAQRQREGTGADPCILGGNEGQKWPGWVLGVLGILITRLWANVALAPVDFYWWPR